MRIHVSWNCVAALLLTSCGARDEFPHQTIEAYQSNDAMRSDVLQKCADRIVARRAFNTQSDTDECRKAVTADQNVRFARYEAHEQAAANAALSRAAKQFEGE